jgi:hypothetical protein
MIISYIHITSRRRYISLQTSAPLGEQFHEWLRLQHIADELPLQSDVWADEP